jgi:aerobic carbon-monoxide dehydrogenase medium subunit
LNTELIEPAELAESIALLQKHGDQAKLIAGGTSVVLMLQQRLIAPRVLISLGRIKGYDFIRREADGLHIGALSTLRSIERSQVVQEFCPALAHAFGVVGNVRVRHQATIGGNLAAADYASDPPSMLTALNARIKIAGPEGSHELPLSDFFLGFYTTALDPLEIVTEIVIPSLPPSARASYFKFTSTTAEGRPCVAVGTVADFDTSGRCQYLRIAVGAAVETPQRVMTAEARAQGQPLSDELISAIAEEYGGTLDALADAHGSAWYRRQMIRVFVKRSLEEVRDGHR